MRTLILCAHTDDEVGCAGTMARMVEENEFKIRCIFFSDIERSLIQEEKSPNAALMECRESMEILGITDYSICEFPVRDFPAHRQEILERMVKEKKSFKPDLIFVPAYSDIHQDHQVITREAMRAFKHKTILGCEMPQNTVKLRNVALFQLTKAHIQKKVDAISCYKSQSDKEFLKPEFIWNLARLRGVQAGSEYAETFEVIGAVL